ncbi:MAG: hypothetical protein NTV30_11000, partial [Chloroflexi bacterium]|nr:hypothetical protein [Chloroflexota bacterium]
LQYNLFKNTNIFILTRSTRPGTPGTSEPVYGQSKIKVPVKLCNRVAGSIRLSRPAEPFAEVSLVYNFVSS